MAAKSETNPFVIWTFLGLGLIFVLIGYMLRFAVNDGQSGVFDSATIAVGISFLASILVFWCGKYYEKPATITETIIGETIIKIVHGHEKIYEEYKNTLQALGDDNSRVVRTVASLPPSEQVAKKWDDFLCDFLRGHEAVIYKRVCVKQTDNEDWNRRLKEIHERYLSLDNYQHFEVEGPPSIECLLVEGSGAFVTFASVVRPVESFGLFLKDERICKALESYFENHLLPRCNQVSGRAINS